MDVLDRQRNILVGHRLELERREFETCPLIELGTRYPYHGELLEDELTPADISEQQTKLQLEVGFLLHSFLLFYLLICVAP